jgi:mediator of RNA polymerase II transcription subunit 13
MGPSATPKNASELLQSSALVAVNDGTERDHVLLVSYCLSDNQRWLLATATNGRGTLIETCMINMSEFVVTETVNGVTHRLNDADLPANVHERCARMQYAHAHTNRVCRLVARHMSVIRKSLNMLWSFVVGVLSQGCHPWRVVVGRMGRLGHGELRVWSQLLHSKTLAKYGKLMRDKCAQCSAMPSMGRQSAANTPSILSACLVAFEPGRVYALPIHTSTVLEPYVRVLPTEFTSPAATDSSSASRTQLRTPHDATCTHIIVFPISATRNDPTDTQADDALGRRMGVTQYRCAMHMCRS